MYFFVEIRNRSEFLGIDRKEKKYASFYKYYILFPVLVIIKLRSVLYRDGVCKTCDAVDDNIKGMYQLMAKWEELNKAMAPAYK